MSASKKIIFGFLIFSILFLFLTGCSKQQVSPTQNQGQQSSTQPATQANAGAQKYILDEIAKHNNSKDCWMAISGKVYDVTSAISSHMGGDLILLGCGKDATEMVSAKPAHSMEKSQQNLDKLYIGEVQ